MQETESNHVEARKGAPLLTSIVINYTIEGISLVGQTIPCP
jgi:hypothetical protein